MARLNNKLPSIHTYEGGVAKRITVVAELERTVMACLLWEDTFYENGEDVATRISNLARQVHPLKLSQLAIKARHEMKLRHVPLLLCSILCETGSGSSLVSDTIANVIQRADELTEFLAVYAKVNKTTPDKLKGKLSAQAKKGLAKAFIKFDEYQLAKYNRDGAIKLRDVLFLCHARPLTDGQARLWKKLISNTMSIPETWEVLLSSGKDKGETFTKLIKEEKLGHLATLRNLRNMLESGVDKALITEAILNGSGKKNTLPFRYVAAARAAPSLEPVLDKAMQESIALLPTLKGTTVIMVDVSGSMNRALSEKSDMTRMDAASALASITNSEELRVFSFSEALVECPPRKGMAGVDSIIKSQKHSSTRLKRSMTALNEMVKYDRLIVITDEQSDDGVGVPMCDKAYMINVASYQNGVGYRDNWVNISGFSENVIRYIHSIEQE